MSEKLCTERWLLKVLAQNMHARGLGVLGAGSLRVARWHSRPPNVLHIMQSGHMLFYLLCIFAIDKQEFVCSHYINLHCLYIYIYIYIYMLSTCKWTRPLLVMRKYLHIHEKFYAWIWLFKAFLQNSYEKG